MSDYGPLKKPTAEAIEVFKKTLENNPDADMRPVPNEWLLRERSRCDEIGARLDQCETELERLRTDS